MLPDFERADRIGEFWGENAELGRALIDLVEHKGARGIVFGLLAEKHKAPEVTFLGAQHQPDFGTLYVTFYPSETVIELKSLKEYLYQWRDTAVSYERLLDVLYDHMMQVYEPLRLRLVFETRPRGGISSKLTIDSDWAIRGGKEQFRDWVGLDDTWQ